MKWDGSSHPTSNDGCYGEEHMDDVKNAGQFFLINGTQITLYRGFSADEQM